MILNVSNSWLVQKIFQWIQSIVIAKVIWFEYNVIGLKPDLTFSSDIQRAIQI